MRLNDSEPLRLQAQLLELVLRVGRSVAVTCDLEKLRATLFDALVAAARVDLLMLLETDERGHEYLVRWSHGVFPSLQTTIGVDLGRARYFEVMRTRRSFTIDDLADSSRPADQLLASSGVRSCATVPLASGGELVGLMLFGRSKVEPFGAEELTLLEDVGLHLAHAIVEERRRRKHQELATLKERLSLLLVHDLKNPLAVIKVNVGLLQNCLQTDDAEVQEILSETEAATNRLLGMLVDLIDIGRAEEGGLTLRPTEVVLTEVIGKVLGRCRQAARGRGVDVNVSVPAEMTAHLDAGLFQRVLENLLGNALRYVPDHGLVRILAQRNGARICLCVENNGPSIPPASATRLFEKYGQVDSERQTYGNRGLGLYFCRLVMEAHGGSICLRERAGGGPRFELCFAATSRGELA